MIKLVTENNVNSDYIHHIQIDIFISYTIIIATCGFGFVCLFVVVVVFCFVFLLLVFFFLGGGVLVFCWGLFVWFCVCFFSLELG